MTDEVTVGTLIKVVSIDALDGTVYFRVNDGRTGRHSGWHGVLPERGDLFILSDDGWDPAPAEAWPETNSIAIVKGILDDGTVLLDASLGIRTAYNHRGVVIDINNTVEYNDVDGIVRVVSETPIRSRDFGMDTEDVEREYHVASSGDGPSFGDFGGYPDVIARARELIETQLERREKLDEIGARPVKGVLFTGPPGTGKTHLARIIAHESKADFYLISGPSIVSKWMGDTEETLRRIFNAATASASGRAIIFFDEIDSIAERRTNDSHEASKRLVAQLLTLMDGFDDKGKSVVVIAATNRVDTLDPALTRPGRFDWEIEFGLPGVVDRLEILRVRARELKTAQDLPLEDIAVLSEGWSAADLASIWTEAALVAAGDSRGEIAAEDVAQAYERVAARPRRAYVEEASK
ncbi:AAA family ATPase [Cellulosimicrobium funkei]|uniref:AAA family ATPase n=1 Tax=Cellulosimicrobium funkei TaxID=264251 RepID=UPI00203BB054|nr:AAA family ATPase [Cellulosimicrobium funkei]MCM3534964.1 AAA family ATPase [Cellulosimicrobium funkei]